MNTQKTNTVLLVEDDEFLQRMYASKLQSDDLEVITASDGEKALEIMKEKEIDLVILDILMPKKDGFQVLIEIRSDPKNKKIPVIMLTNLGETEEIKEAKKLGANEYIIKAHMMPSEVLEVVHKYV
jgi:DNA-binding response OmpR family regulator